MFSHKEDNQYIKMKIRTFPNIAAECAYRRLDGRGVFFPEVVEANVIHIPGDEEIFPMHLDHLTVFRTCPNL